MTVLSPAILSFPGNRLIERINRELLAAQLRPALAHLAMKAPILWTSLPSAVCALGALGERAVVYYCGDDFGALVGVDNVAAVDMERRLVARADVIFAAHQALVERFPAERTVYLPHGVVEHHFGHLTFETETGRGTAFHVDLPAAMPAAKLEQSDAETDILVVEDDPDTAVVLTETLARSGFSTAIATNAKEAESLAALRAVKVIMVDLGLPDKDGISLIRTLRAQERTRRVPIIVVTARKLDEAGAAEVDALEVLDWIEKPVDVSRLHNALDLAVAPSDGVRILHVEDDPDVRHLVAQALADTGTIHSVATLAQATAELAKFQFDIVILDMNLPDGSASALLPQLKSHAGQTIPVIVFSARETDVDVSRQVQAVLTKSQNSLDYLVRIVSRLCQSKVHAGEEKHQLAGSSS
jgi:DNA-binding response OmpR family regulator